MTLSWLVGKQYDVFTQFGEDGYIETIFDRIGTTNKWCLEVGAWDGIRYSNTRRLYDSGWDAVLIESDKEKFEQLRKNALDAHCFNIEIESTGPNSLDAILAGTPAPLLLDLISIDIDGEDYLVWEGLKKYSARVVVIEHAYPASPPFTITQATAAEIEKLAERKGYTVVAKTECNSICVLNTILEKAKG